MTRTRLVAVSLFALVALAPSLANGQTKVKFALDWQIQGPQAPFITAKATNAFAARGLDVSIDRGTGSQKTIEQVATGTYDMGYGDINSMIEYNVKNPAQPLVAVYMVLNTPPFSLPQRCVDGLRSKLHMPAYRMFGLVGSMSRSAMPCWLSM